MTKIELFNHGGSPYKSFDGVSVEDTKDGVLKFSKEYNKDGIPKYSVTTSLPFFITETTDYYVPDEADSPLG
jgi:hypothetical protein